MRRGRQWQQTKPDLMLQKANVHLARWENFTAWILSLPALGFMLVMLFGPVFAVLILSFTDWNFGAPTLSFVGWDNFRELARDPVFWLSLRNTLFYVVIVVPASVFIGLGLAILIESHSSLRSFYRAIHFIPVMITTAAALAWEAMLHPIIGLLSLVIGSY